MQRIFVGDVQGCADELDSLIARARSAFGTRFELWLVGDLVNRGPYSLRALRAVRELVEVDRARYVLGNHELALLQTALGLRPLSRTDSFTDVLECPEVDEWIDWLLARPLVATGRLGAQPFAMVHAAAHPDWGLEELAERASRVSARLAGGRQAARRWWADPDTAGGRDVLERLTNCRSVAGRTWSGQVPDDGRVAWHVEWTKRHHGYGVVYGHWSLQGLHVAPWLRGLDTGCVHHGRSGARALTAWLPDERRAAPFAVPDEGFWQIPARRAYYASSLRAAR